MADEADIAQERMELEEALRPRPVSKDLTPTLGDCQDCGEELPLVDSMCCDCRKIAERRARA